MNEKGYKDMVGVKETKKVLEKKDPIGNINLPKDGIKPTKVI